MRFCGQPITRRVKQISGPGLRIDAVQLAGLDQQRQTAPVFGSLVAACERAVLSRQGDCGVILPMSGRKSLSTTDGTRCTVAKSDEPMATWSTLRPYRAWSPSLRRA